MVRDRREVRTGREDGGEIRTGREDGDRERTVRARREVRTWIEVTTDRARGGKQWILDKRTSQTHVAQNKTEDKTEKTRIPRNQEQQLRTRETEGHSGPAEYL